MKGHIIRLIGLTFDSKVLYKKEMSALKEIL